jgi:hypothetical protein
MLTIEGCKSLVAHAHDASRALTLVLRGVDKQNKITFPLTDFKHLRKVPFITDEVSLSESISLN